MLTRLDATLVSRDTIEEAVENLALACARGPRQYATIVELVAAGNLPMYLETIPTKYGYTTRYGRARLPHASWRNMRKRLKEAGFLFDNAHGDIQMYWAPRRVKKED
jgi:hypothetical protein